LKTKKLFSQQLQCSLEHPSRDLLAFQKLLEPCDDGALEAMAQRSLAVRAAFLEKRCGFLRLFIFPMNVSIRVLIAAFRVIIRFCE